MKSGKLRQKITIQKRPTEKDGYNQKSGDWADVDGLASIWANVNDLNGVELVRAQKIVAEATEQIIMRGFPGWRGVITPACRAISGVRLFDIKYVGNPDSRDRELHLLCVEII
jgi:SPP1 family predicted phage head-tail adaptor